jgi:hypothetical protein
MPVQSAPEKPPPNQFALNGVENIFLNLLWSSFEDRTAEKLGKRGDNLWSHKRSWTRLPVILGILRRGKRPEFVIARWLSIVLVIGLLSTR